MGKKCKAELVKCNKSSCRAYGFCSHAIPHVERENCYNDRPEERTSKNPHDPHIVCPICEGKGQPNQMFILNWNLIISNAITAAISGMFTAIGVYMAMKMIKHAEGNDAKAELKKIEEEKKEGNQNGVSLP